MVTVPPQLGKQQCLVRMDLRQFIYLYLQEDVFLYYSNFVTFL